MSKRLFSDWHRAITRKLTPSNSKSRRAKLGRNLAFESLESRQLLSVTTLQDFAVSENTGEKPQSKVWEYDDQWYTVMPTGGATWLWRLDGTQWTRQLAIAQDDAFHADIKVVDNLVHVLLFAENDTQLAALEFDHGADNRYEMWSLRPQLVNVPLSGSTETAALEVDSTGRMWVVSDPGSNVEVRYSDGLYTDWSSSLIVGSGMKSDDIAAIAAMPNGSIGVMWSDQGDDRFYFRTHTDGANATDWSPVETAASQSARGNMADDHINLAVASDGTLYAAVKTSLNGSNPLMVLLVRRPNGQWDHWYPVDSRGTRPIVVVNEAANKLLFVYTSKTGGGSISYAESPLDNISLGPSKTLISGNLNDPSSVKGSFLDEVVVIAQGGGDVSSVLFRFDSPIENTPPAVSAGPDQIIQYATGTTLAGTITDDGEPNGSVSANWSVVSAPGSVVFDNNSSAQTSVTFSTAGTYVLRLTGDDGQLQSSDTVTVTVEPPPPAPASNEAPTVDAGATQQVALGQIASLGGTVTDDGLPTSPGTFTTTWTQVNGPGTVTFGNPNAVDTSATFSATGSYLLRLTATDGEFTTSDTVTVTVFQSTEPISATFQNGVANSPIYAGTADTQISASAPNSNFGNNDVIIVDGESDSAALLRWDISSIPTGSTIASAMIELNITNSSDGNYELYALDRAWDELSANWEQASGNTAWSTGGADGGGDYNATPIGQLNPTGSNGTYQIALNEAGLAAVQAWVDDPSSNFGLVIKDYAEANNTTTVTTTNTYRWGRRIVTETVTQEIVDPVQIAFSSSEADNVLLRPELILDYMAGEGTTDPPVNETPAVNAGADQSIQLPSNATLNGTVTDDGLPNSTVTSQWTVVSGPGTVTFGNANSANTSASFSTAGMYTLRLTASDGSLADSDEVVINVAAAPPQNQAPIVNAGIDQTIQLPANASLSGTVTDDGLPNSTVTTQWTVASGPGTVTFGNANSANTSASFSTAGIYTLRLTASDGSLPGSDEVVVNVAAAAPQNQAPVVNAGANQSIQLPSNATLNGTVTDDGLPNSTVTSQWTVVSGPGTVTFGNANSANTTASFSTAGTYTLRLTASDGSLASSDEVVIEVIPPMLPTNTAPTVDVGPNLSVQLPNGLNLSASVTDDGLPSGTLSLQWTASGPGNVTFGNRESADTTVQFSEAGAYTLRLTVDDGELTVFDELTVTVNEEPAPEPEPTIIRGRRILRR